MEFEKIIYCIFAPLIKHESGSHRPEDHTRVKDAIISTTDADIDLLIGTNAPKTIEQIISSQGEGPYAVRTLLGWVVNGPLKAGTCNDIPSHTVSRISGHKLHEMLIAQYNTDFSERSYEEVKELSIEDRCFLKIANESTKIVDGL